MKRSLLLFITAITLLIFPNFNFAQAPTLGSTANFVLFTSVGAVTNTGISQVTGDVGSNTAAATGFGNVNGVMESINAATALCATDLTTAYNQLNADVPTMFPAPLLGNGQVLTPGIYSIASPATLNLGLTLDALGNPNAVFIIQINGTFATNALSKVYLKNNALACNVFWKVEGAVSMAAGTLMRGTIIANNAAIDMSTGDTLEGRALSTSGLVSVSGVLAYTPIGCGSPVLTGPAAPSLASAACYTIFSSDGPVTNTGVTHVVGDIGSNLGSTTGFNPLFVTGTIHAVPDASTAACATDIGNAYTYLNTLPYDIELLYPTQLGNGLVLTPHTYIMKAGATLTDTLYLNAEGDASAEFVIQIEGALTESGTGARIRLINGALAQNVYWLINGAVTLNNFSVFTGTIVSTGAVNFGTGDTLQGRVFTTTGAITTAAIVAIMPPGCGSPAPNITAVSGNQVICSGDSVSLWVSATGTGLTYQWRRGAVNVINGGNISGATSDTLTFNPVNISDTAYNYNVIVSGSSGPNDTSKNISLKVNPLPVANAGPDKSICTGDSTIIGTSAIVGVTYSWSPSTGLSSSTAAQPEAKPILNTTYILTVTNTITGCKNADTVKVTVGPTLVVNAGPDKTICKNDSVSIGSPPVIGVTYNWLPVVGLSSSTSSQPNASPAITTTYTLLASNGSCTGTDTVKVTVNPLPIANAGLDKTICKGDSTSIGTPAIVGVTYSWLPVLGLNSSLIAQPEAKPSLTTTYTLTSTNTLTGCKNTDTIKVTVGPVLIVNAGPDKTICKNDSVSIGSASVVGITYSWLPVIGLNSSTSSQPNASPAITTTYTLTASNGTCSGTDTVVVTVDPLPIANAGLDKTICKGDSTSIGTPSIIGVTYSWLPTLGLNSSLIAQPEAKPSLTTTYTLTSTNTLTGCKNTDSVKVTVLPQPIANAGPDKGICAGDSVTIGAPSIAGITYSWLPVAGLNSAISSQPNASPALTTTYTLTVTNGTCSNTDTVIVTVNTKPIANAGPDKSICKGDSTMIGTVAILGYTYSWLPSSGLNAPMVAQPNASPSSTTNYIVTV
ncbi:MAG TPA: ice-binding family protein, partial [Bacteroidia bacterium]|nr:ice-binding family protein [Bacteroidia bacterium]